MHRFRPRQNLGYSIADAALAQLAEQFPCKEKVGGSNPLGGLLTLPHAQEG